MFVKALLYQFIFNLVAELLAITTLANKGLQGIQIHNIEIQISQLTDSTSIHVKGHDSILHILPTLTEFSYCPGDSEIKTSQLG